MLKIWVMRAVEEGTAQMRGRCAVCQSEFELGSVYAWANIEEVQPEGLCERCLRGLCEFAHREGLDVPWKDAYAIYHEARQCYTEPLSTSEQMRAMSVEEQDRVLQGAYLT